MFMVELQSWLFQIICRSSYAVHNVFVHPVRLAVLVASRLRFYEIIDTSNILTEPYFALQGEEESHNEKGSNFLLNIITNIIDKKNTPSGSCISIDQVYIIYILHFLMKARHGSRDKASS